MRVLTIEGSIKNGRIELSSVFGRRKFGQANLFSDSGRNLPGIFLKNIIQKAVKINQIKIIVYDSINEVIELWIS